MGLAPAGGREAQGGCAERGVGNPILPGPSPVGAGWSGWFGSVELRSSHKAAGRAGCQASRSARLPGDAAGGEHALPASLPHPGHPPVPAGTPGLVGRVLLGEPPGVPRAAGQWVLRAVHGAGARRNPRLFQCPPCSPQTASANVSVLPGSTGLCWQEEMGTPTRLAGVGELGLAEATGVVARGCHLWLYHRHKPPVIRDSSWPGAGQHLAAGKVSDPFQMWPHSYGNLWLEAGGWWQWGWWVFVTPRAPWGSQGGTWGQSVGRMGMMVETGLSPAAVWRQRVLAGLRALWDPFLSLPRSRSVPPVQR